MLQFVSSDLYVLHGADQVTSENSIPLSPQWLYAKASDSKVVFLMYWY